VNILTFLPKAFYYNLWLNNYFEREMAFIQKIVKKGDVVFDVGANYGRYTRCFSELVGETGRVLAFEPVNETFSILSANVNCYNLKNVELFNIAIWNKKGFLKMKIPKKYFVKWYYASHVSDDGDFQVWATMLDDFLNYVDKLNFIKIDCYNPGNRVLKGASALVEKFKPAILIETIPNSENKKFFRKMGYEIFWFDGYCLTPILPSKKSSNYFLIPLGSKYERFIC